MKKINLLFLNILLLSSCNNFSNSSSSIDSSQKQSSTFISSSISSNKTPIYDENKELLKSSDFEDLSNWNIYPNNEEKRIKVLNYGNKELEMEINNNGISNYDGIQVTQDNIVLDKNRTYKINFKIKSNVNRSIKFLIESMDYDFFEIDQIIELEANKEYEFNQSVKITKTARYSFGFMLGNINGTNNNNHIIKISTPSLYGKESFYVISEGIKGTYDEAPSIYKEKKLVWHDEFNDTSINKNNWSFDIGTGNWGWGNNEKQYYTDYEKNVKECDGSLKIIARKEQMGNASYTSGRIVSKNKYSFKYGYCEARLALPSISGIWPAFWMLGANIDEVGWPKCGEIDIMEAVNFNNVVYTTLHWNSNGLDGEYSPKDYGNGSGSQKGYLVDDRTEYHTYGMEWTEEYIKTYVDDVEVFSMKINTGSGKEAFQKEHYFLFNVAVGGQWPGYNIDDLFPQAMSIDYIRVYQ